MGPATRRIGLVAEDYLFLGDEGLPEETIFFSLCSSRASGIQRQKTSIWGQAGKPSPQPSPNGRG